MTQAGDLWTRCTGSLRDQVSESTWQLWLSGIEPVAYTDGEFVLSVPNGLIRERVESRYLPMIEDTLANEVGPPCAAASRCRTRGPARRSSRPTEQSSACPPEPGPSPGQPEPAHARPGRDRPAVQLDTKFTFETFVAASSNRLAHAAAQAVAETPGRSYNPLFIYGDSGLGKTHLLHAIGNYVTENYPRRKVLYVTTETFMNDFVDSLRTSTTLTFKRRYRDCDVLLIDDVQFMERKEGLQEEFFHTYNDLKGASKQIVLTSDRPPKSIETLEDRLRSRFLSGLITEIDPPDLETRLAILRSKCLSEHQDVPDDVLEFIASHVKDNIRELEGALIRICAFANLNKEPISLAQAEKVLSDLVLAGEPRRITPQMILDATSAQLRLLGRGHLRSQPHPPARHRPPGRHVPDQGAHGLQLSGHRAGLRQARPHDRHPRRGQDHRPDGGAPADLRPGHRADPEDPCRLGLSHVPSRRRSPARIVVCRGQSPWIRGLTAWGPRPACPQPPQAPAGRDRSTPCPTHIAMGTAIGAPSRDADQSSTIHTPYYLYKTPFFPSPYEGLGKPSKGQASVKFRSERDALVDMLATASRAVGGRGGSSPVLLGLLLSCEGNALR